MNSRVSIVLPTYNQAEYLIEALEGIYSQSYGGFELIVVNDGSTDESGAILAEYRARYGFRLIETENNGLPRALNTGFSLSEGEYLTWTSSDNVMLPEMLSVLVRALDQYREVGMVYADWNVIDERGSVIAVARSREYDRLLLLRDNYINACFLYRRACQEKAGWYSTNLQGGEDWDYWLRIGKHFQMQHVKQVLYQYRVHTNSLTAHPERLVQYHDLSSLWKRDDPVAWYASKAKWHLLKGLNGRPPTVLFDSHPPYKASP